MRRSRLFKGTVHKQKMCEFEEGTYRKQPLPSKLNPLTQQPFPQNHVPDTLITMHFNNEITHGFQIRNSVRRPDYSNHFLTRSLAS